MGVFNRTEEEKKKDKRNGFIVVIAVGFIWYFSSGSDDKASSNSKMSKQERIEQIKTSIPDYKEPKLRQISSIPKSQFEIAEGAMKDYPGITDASVVQKNQDLSLACYVSRPLSWI